MRTNFQRIHILGASGSTWIDTDDHFWKTKYSEIHPVGVRLENLQRATLTHERWVLSGSLCGWGDPLIPLFDLVIFVALAKDLRYDEGGKEVRSRFGHEEWLAKLDCPVLRLEGENDVAEKWARYQEFVRMGETFYNAEDDIIETRLTGTISNDDVLAFIDAMVQLTLQHGCTSWIVDFTQARYKLSTMQIYDLPTEVFKKMNLLGDKKYQIRRAIVRVNDGDDFSFLESVAKNRGQNLLVFSNRREATRWLKEKSPS